MNKSYENRKHANFSLAPQQIAEPKNIVSMRKT